MPKIIKDNNGQAILETACVIISVILLLGGIINIWLWANKQLVIRQSQYNATRVQAGTSSDTYTLQWPVYTPENLPEEKVLLER